MHLAPGVVPRAFFSPGCIPVPFVTGGRTLCFESLYFVLIHLQHTVLEPRAVVPQRTTPLALGTDLPCSSVGEGTKKQPGALLGHGPSEQHHLSAPSQQRSGNALNGATRHSRHQPRMAARMWF